MNRIRVFLTILSMAFIFSCGRKEGAISITCTDVEKFQCNEGIINVEQRELGDILILDTITKNAYSLDRLRLLQKDTDISTKRDSMTVLTAATFQFQFSGEISKVPADVKSSIESEIQKNTTFYLVNSIRKSIHNSIYLINHVSSAEKISYNAALHEKNTIMVLITSVTYADKFKFRALNSSDNKMHVDTKAGNFNLQLNYNCQNSLEINAKQDGIFYKVSYFKLDSSGNLIFTTFNTDLTKYKMQQNMI